MHDLETAFLADIKANPHDWLPRLVFADWLEEQGDERAELIRLSHDLTRLQCEDRLQKEARLQELREAGVEWPTPKLENGLGLEFVLIPPGEFLMGSPEDEEGRGDDEKQVEVVLTRGFWLGKYTVTQQEWLSVMGTTPWENQGAIFESFESLRHPASCMSWHRARKYCDVLTRQEQGMGRLSADFEYSLPTEAQWEYACRAGTTSRFFYGDDPDFTHLTDYGWFKRESQPFFEQGIHEVGLKKPNAWGFHDVHANVWEYCRDRYVDNPPGGKDPEVRDQGSFRVIRGGSWYNVGEDCDSTSRNGVKAEYQNISLGFRVACVPFD